MKLIGNFPWLSDYGNASSSPSSAASAFTIACAAISNSGAIFNPKNSQLDLSAVTIPNDVIVYDCASQKIVMSKVGVGKSLQAGGGHLLIRDTRQSFATRVHIEPSGYVAGTASKLDLMFDPYEDDGVNYRIRNIFCTNYDPADSATTLGSHGIARDSVKGVGDNFGIYPAWHFGFSDAGAGPATPFKLYYFDTSDTVWRTPLKGAWRTGLNVTSGDYALASFNLYQAASTGLAGTTKPSHTSGTVNDGSVDWTFVRNFSAVSSQFRANIVIGDRDDLPKFGFPSVRMQWASDQLVWHTKKLQFLDNANAICWETYVNSGTDDYYIATPGATQAMRFDKTGQFYQTVGMAKLTSSASVTSNSATPSVAGTEHLVLGNTAVTSVTAFSGILAGQCFTVEAGNSNTTLVNSANLLLADGVNRLLVPGEVLTFRVNSGGTACRQVLGNGRNLSASAVYDPASIPTGSGVTTTISVTGAALGDFVLVSFSLDLQGIALTAYVSAANTVSVWFQNGTGSAVDLASGTLKVRVSK